MAQTKVQLLMPNLGDVIDFDSSTLFMDGADNRVGIRNTNPQYELDVTGTVNATNFRGNIQVGTIDDWITHTGDTNTKFGFPEADNFTVECAGNERFRVKPTNDIAVFTGSNSGTLTIRNDTSNEVQIHSGGSDALILGSGGENERLRITSGGKTILHGGGATGANNTATILENGNTLNIHGTSSSDGISVVRYSADYGAYGINIGKSRNSTFGTNTLVQDGNELGHISFYGADGTDFEMAAQITAKVDGSPATGGDATDMPGALSFRTTPEGSDSPTERLRIDSSGNLTIPTTDAKIMLKDGNNYIQFVNADKSFKFVNAWGAGEFIFNVNGGERLRITSGGSVRIGGSTPVGYSAHPNVDDIVVGGTSSHGITILTGNSSTGSLWFDSENGDRGYIQYAHNEEALILGTEGNERLRILSNGNVRQTKTTTNANFTLSRNESITSNNTPIGVIDFASNTAHTVQARIMAKTLGTSNVGGDLVVETRASGGSLDERLRITGAGVLRVIPVDTTSSYATTDGGIETPLSISSTGTSSSQSTGIQFSLNKSGETGAISEIGAIREGNGLSGLVFRTRDNSTGRNERVRIDSSGRLLLGTSITTQAHGSFDDLIIKASDAGNAGITIVTGTSNQATIAFSDGTSGTDQYRGYIQYSHNGDKLALGAAGDDRLQIDSSGRVIIGSSSNNTSRVGDSALQVYSPDKKHPAIRATSTSVNGLTLFSDAYKTDESQVNIGVSYSSASFILSSGCKVSDSADDAYLSSQDTYSTRPCALRISTDGSLSFHTTETSANRTTDSAVSLTEVFNIDRVGNIRQKITGRHMYFGASQQLKIGVSGSDPLIDAVSGDLILKNTDTTIAIVRDSYLQMIQDIRFNAGKGVNFINNTDTATGETVSSSVLDEYEEGTWVPANQYLTITNNNTATYTKVGRLVTIQFDCTYASSPADTAQVGGRIEGLPFTPQGNGFHFTPTWLNAGGSAVGDNESYNFLSYVEGGSNKIKFFSIGNNCEAIRAQTAGKRVRGTVTYMASA